MWNPIVRALLICGSLLASPQTSSGAFVGGTLATNTVWASGASYIVTNTIVVPEGVTLAMGAGTVVAFDAGQGLTVNGRVLAEGSSNAPVLFTRSPANGTRWGGVLINGTVGSLESQFVNSRFEFNGNIAIHSVGGTLLLEGVTFGTTDRQYVSLDGSSFLLSHCYFPSSSTPFELVHGSGGIKGGGRGIVRNCFFGTTTGYNDIIDFTGGNRPGQPIFQCYNNVFAGSGDDILDLDGTDAWIEGNIFLHCHRNGSPDSASAVSGGDYGSETSQVTIIGNLFYDCDQAATAKQGNFFVIMNNTIARITNAGGEDSAAGVVNVRDVDLVPPTTFAAGLFLEGNIIVDADQLVRNYVAGETTVTWTNNILPRPWDGPGGSNTLADPLLSHIPVLSETFFTNWSDAQIFRSWFSPQPGSPAIGTGPNGTDKGGVIPLGASLSGAPEAVTTRRDATLWVGINRSGNGIPPLGWPEGAGYTHYRWRFDGAEFPQRRARLLLGHLRRYFRQYLL